MANSEASAYISKSSPAPLEALLEGKGGLAALPLYVFHPQISMTRQEPSMGVSLKSNQTALLIVHLQPDIIEPGTAFGDLFAPEAARKSVVAQTNRAAKSIRAFGGTVVALRIAFSANYRQLNPSIPLLRMAQEANSLVDGTKNADFVPELDLTPEDILLTHHRPGPFTGTALEGLLRDRNIQNVIVGGVATNASVE